MWRAHSFEKILILGKIEGRRRRGQQRMKWLDGNTDVMDMGLGRLQKLVMDREVWRAAVHGVAKSWTWLSNWAELNWIPLHLFQENRRRNTFKIILSDHHYPDNKTRQRHYKKRMFLTNIPDKHKCKIPQQNITKLNLIIH